VSATACSEIVRNNGLAVAGLFAGLVGLVALYFNARRTHTDRLRLTNDTYVKAIEQLASDSMEVRIGGMYALEQIAKDEQRYHWPVIETLSAYIRERAPWPERGPEEAKGLDAVAAAIAVVGDQMVERLPQPDHATAGLSPPRPTAIPLFPSQPEVRAKRTSKALDATDTRQLSDETPAPVPIRAPTDIQTALTIIGHRSKRWREARRPQFAAVADRSAQILQCWGESRLGKVPHIRSAVAWMRKMLSVHASKTIGGEPRQIDLRCSDLRRTDLSGSNFARTLFCKANLTSAIMDNATLIRANFEGAILDHTRFDNADIRHSNIWGTSMKDVFSHSFRIDSAIIVESTLENSKFLSANMKNIFIRNSNLRNILCDSCDLEGSQIWDSNMNNANMSKSNLCKAKLMGIDFSHSYLGEVDFRNAELLSVILEFSQLHRAKFSSNLKDTGVYWDDRFPPAGLDTVIIEPD
ncbi:MAG: pentapeptide repeat-containing protein, partial [Alphaproteobacteria bacterium]|nr:pentapeptide repeat-containing protein [Alphaproteobacteria bacterium]